MDQEVETLAEALGREMRCARGFVTQVCPVCRSSVTSHGGIHADAAELRAHLFAAYDEHECERLTSQLFTSNAGLDELYARIEMASVELAGRAQNIADARLRERAELESRTLAARAKSLAWILRIGAVGRAARGEIADTSSGISTAALPTEAASPRSASGGGIEPFDAERDIDLATLTRAVRAG